MTDITQLRATLNLLCDGTYSRDDVNYFIDTIHQECKKYIFRRYSTIGIMSPTGDFNKEITDYAYDFIGPMLGRDAAGRFYILDAYFSNFQDATDADYLIAFNKFINTHFHSEWVRTIEEIDMDSFSKSFYRSISYIIKKHTGWIKSESPGGGKIIKAFEHELPNAEYDDLYAAYAGICIPTFSKYIEAGLVVLLDEMKLQVRFSELRKYLRENMKYTDSDSSVSTYVEPELELTKKIILNQTVKEINRLIIAKYVSNKKLSEVERQAFIQSLELLLTEWITYSSTRNHADYLSKFLPDAISVEKYRRKYRNVFEYVVRKAKLLFSAILKSIINK